MTEEEMKLRDEFAKATLSALVIAGEHDLDREHQMHDLARTSYRMAFWMMLARDEKEAYEPENV